MGWVKVPSYVRAMRGLAAEKKCIQGKWNRIKSLERWYFSDDAEYKWSTREIRDKKYVD